MTNKNKTKYVEEKAKELFTLLGSAADISTEEKEGTILVNIDARDETGLLIGRHGDTINSLQTILSLIVRETLEDKRILVNVGDWREKQEEKLEEIANQTAERAIETQTPQPIYSLTPSQRRVIHLFLGRRKDLETESTGEGENRYLLVKPKKK